WICSRIERSRSSRLSPAPHFSSNPLTTNPSLARNLRRCWRLRAVASAADIRSIPVPLREPMDDGIRQLRVFAVEPVVRPQGHMRHIGIARAPRDLAQIVSLALFDDFVLLAAHQQDRQFDAADVLA